MRLKSLLNSVSKTVSKQFFGHYVNLYAINRSYSKSSVDAIATVRDAIKSDNCRNVLIVCGAGISTPSGIPDFRTAQTGLYDNLDEYELESPTDIFDLSFFRRNPYPFFRLAKSLYPGRFPPNDVHYFFKLLSVKNKLLRIYTQNIDMLETAACIPDDRVVFAHGSFATASCTQCKHVYEGDEIKDDIMNDILPLCRRQPCQGVIKPDIVFFGEDLPQRFYNNYKADLHRCDLLLVFGTSLEVFPVAGLVYQVAHHIPRVLINKDIVDPFNGDYQTRCTDVVIPGDLLQNVDKLVLELNWKEEFYKIKNQVNK